MHFSLHWNKLVSYITEMTAQELIFGFPEDLIVIPCTEQSRVTLHGNSKQKLERKKEKEKSLSKNNKTRGLNF